jgi:hypothetical protein
MEAEARRDCWSPLFYMYFVCCIIYSLMKD